MSHHFATHRPLVMSTNWMITADHPLAAQAGAAVLENGGNAVDAAIAANLVMAIVKPHMCGIGGDLFMLIHMAGKGTFQALNASGRAPASASLDAYGDLGYQSVPETGILSCTVPGAIAGWQAALEKHGAMGLDTLLARALPYAQNGFPVYPDLVNALNQRQGKLLILKNGQPAILLGTPGADGQTQTNIQIAVDIIDHKADPQQACEAPRWRSNPDGSLMMENRFPKKTVAALRAKGHNVQLLGGYAEIMGSSQVIMIDRENGVLKAGADPRRQAYAIGK